jgi:hypothetical protein
MIKKELQVRARRLIEGRGNVEDLDRLFLEQRQSFHGKESFRELGDFLAHRDERNKGPVTQRVRDIFTSFRVWSLGLRGVQPTEDDLRSAGLANLRLLTDQELKERCGMHRDAARTKFEKALRKLKSGFPLSDSDAKSLDFLANRFFWKPAFTDEVLHQDFVDVLIKNEVLTPVDRALPVQAKDLLTLYAIARLHGAAIRIEDGHIGTLYAGYANVERRLEVKIDMGSDDWPKPIQAPVCVFWTTLRCDDYCDAALIGQIQVPTWNTWKDPIEVGPGNKLRLLT